ncbi:unnamed protein product [Phytophthora lilii]|uniref:Unnamed protein product n=1 Tax=Phytophthora lilii TaxID=2077276 RepID=A0A9W6TQ43_9STRA|nr:unnamed protein product [Phytophthora lilii]
MVSNTSDKFEAPQVGVGNGTTSDRGGRRGRTHGYTSSEREPSGSEEVRRRAVSESTILANNCSSLENLTHLADTNQPVQLDTFRRGSVASDSIARDSTINSLLCSQLRPPGTQEVHGLASEAKDEENKDDKGDDDSLDTELLEAYIAYCRSVGHEPNISLDPSISVDRVFNPQSSGSSTDADTSGVSDIRERPMVSEHQHFWTKFIGTRFSKRRGCTQFWVWMLIGVGVLLWLGISLSSLQLNEVLHLDAFTVQNVQVTEDYTYLHFLEEVDFHLTYTIETPNSELSNARVNPNSSYFNALLLNEYEYAHYVDGEPFKYIEAGSKLRTTYAYLPHTYIDNTIEETMYFVVQPCFLERNPTADYCQTGQLPTSVHSSEKIYNLDQKKKMKKKAVWEHFNVTYMSVNPMPVACRSSGWLGGAYLLLFLPYLVITLFGLRVFQMIIHCESYRKNIRRIYSRELNVPENEVDYWQPMPWDRKVPKTRLCGPCCWKKFRRPFEPFYTWWRHENYFTWVFCPYRNERLSRGERALIVVCSLYITFYVLFIIVMLRDSWGANITIFTSVVLYAILVSVLPSAGKAIFKELFKLIFRQRRKYFRAKAAGGDLSGFSFRLAFILQVLVVVLLTLAQAPIFYIWARRSCLFLKKFIYYGVLSAILRMSLMGVAQDFAWYLIIQTWGWKDLCPYCTERIKHCDCFNDELLILAVERVGPKWELIRLLDGLMAKQNHYEPQFEQYTPAQLRERWEVIVERAEKHMEKVKKLCAYEEKKRIDSERHDRLRQNLTALLSRRSSRQVALQNEINGDTTETRSRRSEVDSTTSSTCEQGDSASEPTPHMCNIREKKILALNSKIKLGAFEKHYDSNISEVFHTLTRSVMRLRRHREHRHHGIPADGHTSDDHAENSSPASSSSSAGETMWVFDSPEQRLHRREEEKLQRKRAFRVLNDYDIDSVDSSFKLARRHSPRGSDSRLDKHSRDILNSSEKDSPLLPAVTTDKEVVVHIPATSDFDDVVSANVSDDYSDGSEHPSDLEHGSVSSHISSPRNPNSVYTVTQKPLTLLRRISASASAFAAWALDYDQNVHY